MSSCCLVVLDTNTDAGSEMNNLLINQSEARWDVLFSPVYVGCCHVHATFHSLIQHVSTDVFGFTVNPARGGWNKIINLNQSRPNVSQTP